MKKDKERLFNLLNNKVNIPKIKRYMKQNIAKISVHNKQIYISHKWDTSLKKRYDFYGTIKWDRLLKKHRVTDIHDIETCRFLLEINIEFPNYYWEIEDEAYEIINRILSKHKKESALHLDKIRIKKKKVIDIDTSSFLKVKLMDFQTVGLAFLNKNNGVAMIGDSMGLGKTIQALAYTAQHNLKTIVITPASLKYNWAREISKFTYKNYLVLSEYTIRKKEPNQSTIKYNRLLREDFNNFPEYVIINYEQLEKYEKVFKMAKFDCVVIDESQNMSNTKAKRTKNIKKYFKNIEKRILLSGTPIKNRPIEFYSQLNFLRPDIFSSKEKFGLRYCDAVENDWGRGFDYSGSSNLRELYIRIGSFYIRRLKENVLDDLPEKTINRLDLELSIQERHEYVLLSNDLKSEYKKFSNQKMVSFLARMVKLKMFLSNKKIKQVIKFADQLLLDNPEKKIIIFSQFKSSQNILKNHYGDLACSILAKYSDKKKQEQVDEFQADKNKRVLVSSTKAGGVGFNIVGADTVIFLDLLWNPADHEQAEDRIFRIGQKRNVSIYYMNYINTIESLLWSILEQKLDIMNQVLNGKKSNKEITEKQVIKIFFEKFFSNNN